MKKKTSFISRNIFLSLFFLLSFVLMAHRYIGSVKPPVTVSDTMPTSGSIGDNLLFELNKGQLPNQVLYTAGLDNAKVFVEKKGLTWLLTNSTDLATFHASKHATATDVFSTKIRHHAVRMKFLGSNTQEIFTGQEKIATYRNYIKENDSSKWIKSVPFFKALSCQQFYSGIDLHYYSSGTSLKYDFVVHRSGNINDISWEYEGADSLYIDALGNLHIATSITELIEQSPYVYQVIDNKKVSVSCRFILSNNRVSLRLLSSYDKNYDLIIDPILLFSSYTGSIADNWGMTATPGNDGSLFLGGATFAAGYPTSSGAFDSSFNGTDTDITISKFSSDGSNLIYSTYIGGNDTELPHSLIANDIGELMILGTTSSSNYPTTSGCFDNTFNGGDNITVSGIEYGNGSDMVITKLNATGESLVGSTYVGGEANDGLNTGILKFNYADEARGEIMLDLQGNIYVASCTQSANFPVINGFQNTLEGNQDACIVKLNSNLTSVLWSTYLGGNNNDAAYAIKVDPANGEIFVGGGTRSNNLLNGITGFDTGYNGGTADGFVVRINAAGTAINNGTYLGTDDYDQVYFIEFDEYFNAYAYGQTSGSYPVSDNVYNNPNSGQFIHALTNNLSTSLFSTVFGRGDGNPDIVPSAFLVDICNRIYISGWGGEVNSETTGSTTDGLPTTGDAFQSFTDGSDFYFLLLEENAVTLEYATFFGASGGGPEHVDGGTSRFDKQGIIYQAVCAGCGSFNSFPTTSNAWSQTNNSINCNAGAIKFAFEPPYTTASVAILPGAIGCSPFEVLFNDVSFNATALEWSLDGVVVSTSTSFTHTFSAPGTYLLQLIASNDETCNIADTTVSLIQVLDPLAFTAEFTPEINCTTFTASFVPTVTGVGHFWNFGNGQFSVDETPTVSYTSSGVYTVTHVITTDLPNCPSSDTVMHEIIVAPPVVAQFFASDTVGCIPFTVQFSNTSVYATGTYLWDFGNGQISNEENPTFTYPNPGTFGVTLTASNPQSCNATDTYVSTITALDTIIVADFSYTIPDTCATQTVAFTTALNPTLDFSWQFGDGSFAGDETNITHTYASPGTYTATLIADSPCAEPDTAQHTFTLLPPPIVNGSIVNAPQSGCPPVSISLSATGNAVQYIWDLGDGTTTVGTTVDYLYSEPGIYTIQLIAVDSSTCNISATSEVVVSVYEYANALFTMSTNVIELNDTVYFDNQSTNATDYIWNYGDGTTQTLFEPPHQFMQLGSLQVCLQAMNSQQCNDEYCLPLEVIPVIHIGVPNAFSPNEDNLNDILYVEGRDNILVMTLKIFNRWGELVYESSDPQLGWDGIYKGVPQDIDVFAYTLTAELISGRQVSAQGNITLIR